MDHNEISVSAVVFFLGDASCPLGLAVRIKYQILTKIGRKSIRLSTGHTYQMILEKDVA